MTETMDMLLNGLVVALFTLSVVTLAAGVWIFLSSAEVLADLERTNRRFDVERWLAPFDAPRKIDRVFFRHHRLVGVFLVVGALYALAAIAFEKQISTNLQPTLSGWFLQGAVILLALGCLFGMVIGVLMFFRPSLLRGFETWANSWIPTEKAEHWLDAEHLSVDHALRTHHRATGALVVLGSLYAIVGLGVVVFA